MHSNKRIAAIFQELQCNVGLAQESGLHITSPADGTVIATLAMDNRQTLDGKVNAARAAQAPWTAADRHNRAAFLEALSAAIRKHRELLAELITLEGGKTTKEALGEADGSADMPLKTIKDATLAETSSMTRLKERPPVGVVGLITSFNFPLVVANWTLAPALLAGNAVIWKPSEKTPLVAHAYKCIFASIADEKRDLLQIVIGARDIGEALVSHEGIDMISATGSVAMGKGIKATLAKKKNNAIRPILELGGNNGVIISDKISPEHLEWSLKSLLNSFLGTSGQRCTNTRRLIVHQSIYERAVEILKRQIEQFIASGAIQSPLAGASNDYGYGPLIDKDAWQRFEKAKQAVSKEGGKVLFGQRLLEKEYPDAYYVEPALALLPKHAPIMQEETFAPILFIVPYGDFDEALSMLNAPANAGLVNGIYTQSKSEADQFAARNEAGHGVINSPKGTGTPAFGMGFGGNKESGEGEILNAADPLQAFTCPGALRRIAQNKDVAMDQ